MRGLLGVTRGAPRLLHVAWVLGVSGVTPAGPRCTATLRLERSDHHAQLTHLDTQCSRGVVGRSGCYTAPQGGGFRADRGRLTFGDLLRRHRLAAGLSQERLAHASPPAPRATSVAPGDLGGAGGSQWRRAISVARPHQFWRTTVSRLASAGLVPGVAARAAERRV
jgi:hypothetical protein